MPLKKGNKVYKAFQNLISLAKFCGSFGFLFKNISYCKFIICKIFPDFFKMLSEEENNIHNRILKIIEDKGLNVNSFSRLIGASPTTIHNIVKGRPDGRKSTPSNSILRKIFIGVEDLDYYWLVTGENKSSSEDVKNIANDEKEELYQSLLIQKLEAQIQDLQADKEELYNLLQNAINNK